LEFFIPALLFAIMRAMMTESGPSCFGLAYDRAECQQHTEHTHSNRPMIQITQNIGSKMQNIGSKNICAWLSPLNQNYFDEKTDMNRDENKNISRKKKEY
jgi:hypothetical protein